MEKVYDRIRELGKEVTKDEYDAVIAERKANGTDAEGVTVGEGSGN